MSQPHPHAHHALPDEPGWSLLRLSGLARLGLASVTVGLIWAATLLVIL
jgi:hypothetical protein